MNEQEQDWIELEFQRLELNDAPVTAAATVTGTSCFPPARWEETTPGSDQPSAGHMAVEMRAQM
jgi:hypothetical protein